MKDKKPAQKKRSIYQAVLFLVFFFLVIVLAIVVRTVELFSHSAYDGEHKFTLGIIESAASAQVVSFSPDTQTISFVEVSGKNGGHSLGKDLEIPIDSYIDTVSGIKNGNISGFLTSLLLRLDTVQHATINQ